MSANSSLGGASPITPDAFIISDYINSGQAVEDISQELNLHNVFSHPAADFWSRLDQNVTLEELNDYWKEMVNAHFDIITGTVLVTVRAFTPKDLLKLAELLVAKSDAMFKRINAQAQHDFVKLAEENLSRVEQRLTDARRALLAFRNKSGLYDAGKMAAGKTSIIDNMRQQLVNFKTQYDSILSYSPNSPALRALKSQIAVLETQIKTEDQALSSQVVKGVSAEDLGRFEALSAERDFAQQLYTQALQLHQSAYLAAENQQSYLAIFVKPALPQKSLYPERARMIAIVLLASAVAWFAGLLVTYAIRDHLV